MPRIGNKLEVMTGSDSSIGQAAAEEFAGAGAQGAVRRIGAGGAAPDLASDDADQVTGPGVTIERGLEMTSAQGA